GVAWLDRYNSDGDYGYKDFYKNVGVSIMGSTTYEQVLGFKDGWDKKMATYVVTSRKLKTLEGGDIRFYSGNLKKLVEKASKETKKDIWLVGGGKLAQAFFNEKLVDRMMLFIMPDMLGEGIPLFGPGQKVELKLTGSKVYKSGVVQLNYEL